MSTLQVTLAECVGSNCYPPDITAQRLKKIKADIFYNFQNFEKDMYGTDTIKELIRHINIKRMNDGWQYSCEIRLDDVSLDDP
jgi:hypothetical protein